MRTNYVPAIVMLLAGAVYCVVGLLSGTPLLDFTVQLLIVLLVFYMLGGIIRMVLDHFMGDIVPKKDKTEEEASEEVKEAEEQEEKQEKSEEEEGI